MKRWISQQALGAELNFCLPLLAILIAGFLTLLFVFTHIVFFFDVGNEGALRTNLYLLALLAAAYTAWIFAVCRQAISTETASGFVLAGCGLACRSTAELMRAMVTSEYWRTHLWDIDETIAIARVLGFVAFAAGLAFVASACMAERRYRGRVPAPLGLGRSNRDRGRQTPP
ncbi:MAG: hypothetical protein QNJ98_20610 [Planctomycetota bacterium]|nr:hypothetical protein [Planctomycetota bacterium]